MGKGSRKKRKLKRAVNEQGLILKKCVTKPNVSIDSMVEKKMPVLAICYDFDKTLSPDDMQAQGYIQSVGYNISDFWTESNALAADNDMDQNLAYMYKMMEKAAGKVLFTKQKLTDYGAGVKLFPGVKEWFKRICEYGKENGVIVEHYIISSGLKEMIEGTSVAKEGAFKKIYASSFYYDENGVAKWPAQVVNYTSKTQFLFRIEKGVLDINDSGVNDYFAPQDIRVPFRNMVYIGDSDTDIPCMKLVNVNGGHSIGVYNPETEDKAKVFKMMRDNRIKYFVPADYSLNSDLDKLVKAIIVETATNNVLQNISYSCQEEYKKAAKASSEEEQQRSDLIIALESSDNFARTKSIIEELNRYKKWNDKQREDLFAIAIRNSQLYYTLTEQSVKQFYAELISGTKKLSENARRVKEAIEKDI